MTSRRDSVGGPSKQMVSKLKEGLQEAVVFLRTLGSYKIPAVIERRRKELLDKLCLLQGDSLKEPPPSIEPPEEKTPPPQVKSPASKEKAKDVKTSAMQEKDGDVESGTSSTASSSVTSPTHGLKRRDSKVVNSLVSNFETLHHSAKKEEESETPKRFVQLKKVNKPSDFPSSPTHKGNEEKTDDKKEATPAPEDNTKDAPPVKEKDSENLIVESGKKERPLSAASNEDTQDGEEEDEEEEKEAGKKKKKGKGLFSGMKGLKKKSPLPERKHPPPPAVTNGEEAADQSEDQQKAEGEEVEPEKEEGVRLSGTLERKVKRGIKKKIKMEVKVRETTLVMDGKEEELAHCSVEVTESGLEVVHPQLKSIVFKVEGGEEQKLKWVSAIKEAIAEATPPEEEVTPEIAVTESPSHNNVPSITVDEVASQSDQKKSKKETKTLTPKVEKKLPDQGVVMKGYLHRKKPGSLSRSWEKTYCVLTYQSMYFTTVEDNKEYSSMLPIYPDSDGKLAETKKGKGHDKHIQVQGLTLKIGKKVEQFSFESQADFKNWKEAIERVLGIGGVEELLSEDEENENSIEPDEDLYEELEPDYIPPVPDSPRPARPSLPPVPVDDDIIIDEDIYEDTDDFQSSMLDQPAPSPQPAPSLPDRNPPKKTASPPPSLPPRAPPAKGTFPARNTPTKKPAPIPSTPQDYEPSSSIKGKPAPALPPVTNDDDEELYDDVIVGEEKNEEIEETYDDVIVGDQGGGAEDEDLYDDVVPTTVGEPIMDEYYEDMAPGTMDSYVTMEKKDGQEEVEDEELYVDVDEPSSPSPVKQVEAPKSSTSKSLSRMFHKKQSVSAKSRSHSGTVSYKAPKKTRFEERWAAVEGTNLLIYKTSTDKRSQDKIPLGECRLELGSTEAGAGKFAFHVCKGEKTYHFSLKDEAGKEEWVSVLKGLVKYAPVEADNEEQEIYQATQDHIADSDQELTFKKGTYIRLISKDSAEMWTGQIGNLDQVFTGKTGKFPVNKVEPAEALYF